ncbi:MAG: peptide ABC transporter substrate-binding protein [Bacilli bacterium]|nr:peptide ABC transporter substrate-binding protein [Bacilli bacterium]MBN2876181.1 peptide ABC transporter substrate-binding protein [Bacilli bacterium]
MKKIALFIVSLALVFAFVGCSKAEAVKTVDFSEATVYSMDLTDIPGYDDVVTNGTWAETYDVIIGYAKLETDAAKRTALYHAAEDLLMSTGTTVPIYYYTDIYMASTDLEGFFSTPTGSKFFKYTTLDGSGDALSVCLSSEPSTIDPALNSAVDGATMILHAFSGLIGYNSDGELVADLATAIPTPTENTDGTATYVFELRSDLKWSDGSDLTAADFEYAWKRAAADETAADYGYLFAVIDGYGTEDGLNVTATDDTHLSVTLTVDVPYFLELMAFPTFMPVQEAAITADADGWATDPTSYITNGAYYVSEWDHNSKIVLTKNDNYWNADSITMDEITFYLSDDDTAILAGFLNGTYDFIDSVPNDEIASLQTEHPAEFFIAGQLGTYYITFNNNTDFLPSDISEGMTTNEILEANQEIRLALSLLLDRNYVVEEIGQAGQLPAASFVAMGITNADGSQFYESAGSSTTYIGFYDTAASAYAQNCATAVDILSKYFDYNERTKKFTNFPSFDYLYNTSTGHQAIGEYIQAAFAQYGITITLVNQEWGTFLETRKNGDYVLARNGWLADFNDPISFLDMWVSSSGNNDAQLGVPVAE